MERPKGSIMSQAEKEGATTMFESRLEFKGAVIGMILGDGYIAKLSKEMKHTYLCIRHGHAQKDYAEYKAKMLEWLTSVTITDREQPFYHKDGVQKVVDVRTKTHPLYTRLRDRFYYDNRKTITDHLMRCITPCGLALWYQDDGCLTYHTGYQEVYINTQCFNEIENELMARMLQKRFGLQFRVNRSQSKYYCLRLRRKDRSKFLALIKDFIAPSMVYKTIITDKWESLPGTRQYEKIEVTCVVCGKTYERHHKEGNKYLFCGDCWTKNRIECKSFSNNNGRDQYIAY
jgi:hypothetical protein